MKLFPATMSINSVSDLFRAREKQRNNSVRTEADMDFREGRTCLLLHSKIHWLSNSFLSFPGVLLLNNDGVFVQRYFTYFPFFPLWMQTLYLKFLIFSSFSFFFFFPCPAHQSIYEFRIVYAYRGKERRHEFSPLTTIEESPAGLRGQYTFRISTDGQKTMELSASNREDMSDWIKGTKRSCLIFGSIEAGTNSLSSFFYLNDEAVKDEVGKIVTSIMEDFERTGYGPHESITQGSGLEEGIFGSYILRQQGTKVSFSFSVFSVFGVLFC